MIDMTRDEMYEIYDKVRREKLLEEARVNTEDYIRSYIKYRLNYEQMVNDFIKSDDGYEPSKCVWYRIIENQIVNLFEL